jgi:uncharacterized protein YcbK (DUF882 family)
MISETLVGVLEALRERAGNRAVTVTRGGGYRCTDWEHGQGRDGHSQHAHGFAADIKVEGLTPLQVAMIAEQVPGIGGIGLYSTFVHVDVRQKRARWSRINGKYDTIEAGVTGLNFRRHKPKSRKG